MNWQESGYILSVRRHGESAAIIDILTRERGRHSGLVYGGNSKRLRPVLQYGNKVQANWKARLEDQLGHFTVEMEHSHSDILFGEASALDALMSACSLLTITLPEREAHARLFDGFEILLESLSEGEVWPAVLVRFELGLLQELGFGLDLTKCAVTGEGNDLTHVSPNSGRAVSKPAAEPYKDRLLPLPPFLVRQDLLEASVEEVKAGFDLTGYFLESRVLSPHSKNLPDARRRMLDRLCR